MRVAMRTPRFDIIALLPCLALTPFATGCGSCGERTTDATVAAKPGRDDQPHIDSTGAGPVAQLYKRTAARYELPSHALPAGLDPKAAFTVEVVEDEGKSGKKKKRSRVFRGKMPFEIQGETRGYAPTGVVVNVDGVNVAYSESDAVSSFGRTWRIRDGQLVLTNPSPPKVVTMSYSGVETAVRRHSLTESGLSPEEFVTWSLTLGDHTRQGLLLPAPALAEWEVAIPAKGARFEAYPTLEPSPMFGYGSDGAAVRLVVVDGGTETEVSRRPLTGVDAAFPKWEADLAAFAGRTVKVRLVTEVSATPDQPGTPDFDYVFVGSPTVWGPPEGETRTIVVIGLDTTRPDHFGFFGYERPTTPNMDRILGESAVFTRAWAPAPRTRPSFRTATTGQYPLDAVGAKNIGEVFQEEGFATKGIVANVHLVPRFDFDDGFDSWEFDGAAKAEQQVDRALGWLEDHADRDRYLFLHFMDPHIVYNAPADFHDLFVEDPDPDLPKKFNRWQVIDWKKQGLLTEQRKAHIEALHDGELRYLDGQLARFVQALDAMPGKKLLVVHSDHGEEFWEHDTFEHNHTLYDEVTRTLLAFRPGVGRVEGKRIDTPVTLADIAPTLYDYAGLPRDKWPTELDGLSLRPLIDGGDAAGFADRPIGVAHLRYSYERWGVVKNDHKYILWTGTGQEELYDLKADPGEQKNLAGTADLAPWRAALSEAHGMPVGPGWRVKVSVVNVDHSPYEIALPAPAIDAFVVDPERTVAVRVNEEWGEKPKKTSADIGEVRLSDDKRTLVWTPGAKPTGGTLFVRFDQEVDPQGARLSYQGRELPLAATDGGWGWAANAMNITLVPGTVFVPPPDEAERMAAASQDERAMLEGLGYIAPEHGDHDDNPPPAPVGENPDGHPDDPDPIGQD
jgi:arylsulfatase